MDDFDKKEFEDRLNPQAKKLIEDTTERYKAIIESAERHHGKRIAVAIHTLNSLFSAHRSMSRIAMSLGSAADLSPKTVGMLIAKVLDDPVADVTVLLIDSLIDQSIDRDSNEYKRLTEDVLKIASASRKAQQEGEAALENLTEKILRDMLKRSSE